MLKRYWKEVTFCIASFLVAGGLLVAASVFFPYQFQHYQATYSGHEQTQEQPPESGLSEVITVLSAVITALATAAIAWFTWTLRRSTDRLAKTGEDQLKILGEQTALASLQTNILTEQQRLGKRLFYTENRPKLELRFVRRLPKNSSIQTGARQIQVEFSIINTGTSPAHITDSRVQLDWFNPNNVPNPDAMAGTDIITHQCLIVGAREPHTIDVADTAPENSFDGGYSEERDSRLEQATLFLLGWVVYHDDRGFQWGEPRTSYFCLACNPITGRFAAIPELADWELTR